MACGVSPFTCGIRAIIGAGAIYVLVSLVGYVLITIVADAAASAIAQKNNSESNQR